LAVILGRERTVVEFALLLATAYVIPVALAVAWTFDAGPTGGTTPLAPFVLLPLLTLPAAWSLLRQVRTFDEPRELNRSLKGTARLSLWHAALFALGLALNGAASGGLAA
jgi:1,4-dihydroxy-2-naphthoate octaprenyltransferase